MHDLKLLNQKIDYLNKFIEHLNTQTGTFQIAKDKIKQKRSPQDDLLSFETILQNKIKFNYPK